MTKIVLQELKAIAFDNLMKKLTGTHRVSSSYQRVKPTSWPSLSGLISDPIMSNESFLETETIIIYEWIIRVKNNVDIAQVLLDEAETQYNQNKR